MTDPDASTEVIDRVALLEVTALSLHVLAGPDRGASLDVVNGTAHVGTAHGNALRLTDPTVSRVHCEVQVTEVGARIVDLGSTNGTIVNGVHVEAGRLSHGATIALGGTSLRVEFGEDPVMLRLSEHDRFGTLIGKSVPMRRLYAMLERAAPTESTILVLGETGTGKEIVARCIHDASPRASGPFVVVDCGSIAETLMESELFGHARGAFSGAVGERRGLFEEANGGTLFLDEIGELPLSLQPKLLRALESREIRRVGETTARRIDVRVLAATNQPLARRVNEGLFREDLYYRIAVVEVELPALRARREDIPLLARHFQERFAGGEAQRLPDDVVASLVARSWPGNVRELRNFIERVACLGWSAPRATGSRARPILSPGASELVPLDLPLKEARAVWLEQFESVYVQALLGKTGGNITRAAEIAGVHRRSLQRMMTSLGLRGADDPE